MNLWSLLLPFKWIIIGVVEVFRGIYFLLSSIVSFIGSLFKYLIEGIIVFSIFFYRSLKAILLGFFKLLKFIIINVGRGIMVVFISSFAYIIKKSSKAY